MVTLFSNQAGASAIAEAGARLSRHGITHSCSCSCHGSSVALTSSAQRCDENFCEATLKGAFAMARFKFRWALVALMTLGLVAAVSATRAKAEDKEKEGDEVKVKFDEVPAAVKAMLTKEAAG